MLGDKVAGVVWVWIILKGTGGGGLHAVSMSCAMIVERVKTTMHLICHGALSNEGLTIFRLLQWQATCSASSRGVASVPYGPVRSL